MPVKLDLHYVEPRLVALYDDDNPRGDDTKFYVQLAAELDPQLIIDLGCGTGLLTSALAGDGRVVVGVDPSTEMLAVASERPMTKGLAWVHADSSEMGLVEADLLLMTGNVAQVFLDDDAWAATLRDIHAALRQGGHLAFESRNPDARAWESWNHDATHTRRETAFGPLEEWLELVSVGDGRVRFDAHNVFHATSEVVVASSELRFRTLAELTDSLHAAGFSIEHVYGDWARGPVTSDSQLFAIVARRS